MTCGETSIVYVVDDDLAFRESLQWLLESIGVRVQPFESAEAFLQSVPVGAQGCLVVDVRMRGMSGLQLQRIVASRYPDLPVIIMTAHGELDMAVQAMKDGALDFIAKPFNDQALIDCVNAALAEGKVRSERRMKIGAAADRLQGLTVRETEVLELVVSGETNRSIAAALGISEKTVETHRSNIMSKTRAGSVAELIHLVLAAADQGIP